MFKDVYGYKVFNVMPVGRARKRNFAKSRQTNAPAKSRPSELSRSTARASGSLTEQRRAKHAKIQNTGTSKLYTLRVGA